MTRRSLLKTALFPAVALCQSALPPKSKITSSVMLPMLSGTFERRLETAARSGVQSVELGAEVHSWSPAELAANRKRLESYGLGVDTIVVSEPGKMSMLDMSRRDAFVAGVQSAIDSARELDAPNLLVWSGPALAGRTRDEQWKSLRETAALGAELAEKFDKHILIEPMLESFVPELGPALKLVQEVDHPRFRLVLDLYQRQAQVGSVLPLAAEAMPYVRVFHVADAPDRQQPGSGKMDYAAVYQAIAKSSFSGVICMDFKPDGPDETAVLIDALDAMRAAMRGS